MAEFNLAQPQRRSLLGPIVMALVLLALAATAAWFYFPHRVADLAVTHTTAVPTHTVMNTGSKLVGHQQQAQDDLYVLAAVRIDDRLRDPLFLSDITATLTTSDGATLNTSAVEKNDIESVYTSFPQVRAASSPLLLRESTIPTGQHAEGMVILHFPITLDDWTNRQSATLTLTFYHQGSFTIPMPKP
jgi:hypothetical protein